jgi:hypothetical protein
MWFRINSHGCYCEHDNESSGSVKDGEFLGQLNNCRLPKKDPDSRSKSVKCHSWAENAGRNM